MSNVKKINKVVDKAQNEAEVVESKGLKQYIAERKVSMNLAAFLITLGSAFVIGAILF